MHLDVEQIERLLAGELSANQAAEAQAHLHGCAACEQRLAEAAREQDHVFALLQRLDHPTPVREPQALVPAARPGTQPWTRLAAGVVLAVVTVGLAYAAPGSPLPRLLGRATAPAAPAAPPAAHAPAGASGAVPAGLAVEPGPSFTVAFEAPQTHGLLRVRLVPGPELAVRGYGTSTALSLGVERITVANRGASADYEVLVPTGAPHVRIEVAGMVVLEKRGDRILAPEPPRPDGEYVLRLATPVQDSGFRIRGNGNGGPHPQAPSPAGGRGGLGVRAGVGLRSGSAAPGVRAPFAGSRQPVAGSRQPFLPESRILNPVLVQSSRLAPRRYSTRRRALSWISPMPGA